MQVGSKWKPLHNVHSVATLYGYFKQLAHRSRKIEQELARIDWVKTVGQLDAWIELIDRADESATLFRYPTTRHTRQDRSKSSWVAIAPTVAISDAILKRSGGIFNLSARGPKASYRYVRAPQRRLSTAIRRTAMTLSATHDHLRLFLSK